MVNLTNYQSTKVILQHHGLLDRNRNAYKLRDMGTLSKVAIPVLGPIPQQISQGLSGPFELVSRDNMLAKYCAEGALEQDVMTQNKHTDKLLTRSIPQALNRILSSLSDNAKANLATEIPQSWEKHGDLILLPEKSFKSAFWNQDQIWEEICGVFKARRLARRAEILNNDFRSPQVTLLYGDDPWVRHKDNGITYSWNITKCMFSRGNITEKLRVASFDCRGETVVDLFAGIGYFSLPFLVHSKCAFLHACEWNPDSIEALKVNMELNSIPSSKYQIHFGDNRIVCPQNVADRVNLGLIPSSEISYEIACKALKRNNGGILHIHGNVKSDDGDEHPRFPSFIVQKCNTKNKSWIKWALSTAEKIATLLPDAGVNTYHLQVLNIVKVKSYAPKVDHLVLDLQICLLKDQSDC